MDRSLLLAWKWNVGEGGGLLVLVSKFCALSRGWSTTCLSGAEEFGSWSYLGKFVLRFGLDVVFEY